MSFTFLAIGGRPWPWSWPLDITVFDMSEFKTNSLIPFVFICLIPLLAAAMAFLSTC